MQSPLQPEFFLLLGVNLFLAMSLLTCLFDKHFPSHLPYLCQIGAFAGFAQLLTTKEFMADFSPYMRFWYSLLYLTVALASIVAVNIYLGALKKLVKYAKIMIFTVTFPALSVAAFFLASYADVAAHPIIVLPNLSWETAFIGIVALDTLGIGLSTYIFFKPKWRHLALGAGAAIAAASVYALFKPSLGGSVFAVPALGLAVACNLVLGLNVYVVGRIWLDTLKQRKKGVKQQNEARL